MSKELVIYYEEFKADQFGRVVGFEEGDGMVYDAYKAYAEAQVITGGPVERIKRVVRRWRMNRQFAAATREAQARVAELRALREAGQVDETKYDVGAFAWPDEVR